MLSRRRFAASLIAGAAAQAVSGRHADAQVTAHNARADELESLKTFAERNHLRGREAAADADWHARWQAVARTANDGEYLLRTRRALAWFGDGHTTVLPFEFTGGVPAALAAGPLGFSLPLRIQLFHDGAYVVAAASTARECLGHRIERIGGLSIAELVRATADTWPGNAAWAHRWAGSVLASPAQLAALGATAAVNAPVEFLLAHPDGRQASIWLSPTQRDAQLESASHTPPDYERWRARKRASGDAGIAAANFVRDLGDGCTYACIDEIDDVADLSFDELTRAVLRALDARSARRLIIDLRRNGGGNNFLAEPLRKGIARAKINRPGGFYVLTGPRTFSAAQNLATRLERESFARFVGEPTGGAPNHFGDAKPFVGESTGLTSIVSSVPWFDSYPQDARPWILPDFPVPDTWADWTAGNDPALRLARSVAADFNVDVEDSERTYYFNRASQSVDWQPFWRRS